MALIDNRRQRLGMLCAMYFAQGVPWGFMTIALISYLTDRGVGDGDAGELTAVVLLPWTFKLVWGPLIDTVTIRSMGRRRFWIIAAEFLMAVSLIGILLLGDLTENLRLLGWMFFIHNCFASLQDVSTDALAVDVLPPPEQGRTNGLMWGSKLIGKGIGGAVMAMAIDAWGLPGAVMVQFGLLLLLMLFPLLLLERPGEKRFPWSRGAARGAAADSSFRSPGRVLRDLRRGFSLTSTSVFVVFGTISMVGWGIVEVITKTLYTQQLGWTFVEVSQVSGSAALSEMAGALLGGYIADRYGRRKVMVMGLGGYGTDGHCLRPVLGLVARDLAHRRLPLPQPRHPRHGHRRLPRDVDAHLLDPRRRHRLHHLHDRLQHRPRLRQLARRTPPRRPRPLLRAVLLVRRLAMALPLLMLLGSPTRRSVDRAKAALP